MTKVVSSCKLVEKRLLIARRILLLGCALLLSIPAHADNATDTRTVDCRDNNGNVVDDSFCSGAGAKPDTTRVGAVCSGSPTCPNNATPQPGVCHVWLTRWDSSSGSEQSEGSTLVATLQTGQTHTEAAVSGNNWFQNSRGTAQPTKSYGIYCNSALFDGFGAPEDEACAYTNPNGSVLVTCNAPTTCTTTCTAHMEPQTVACGAGFTGTKDQHRTVDQGNVCGRNSAWADFDTSRCVPISAPQTCRDECGTTRANGATWCKRSANGARIGLACSNGSIITNPNANNCSASIPAACQ